MQGPCGFIDSACQSKKVAGHGDRLKVAGHGDRLNSCAAELLKWLVMVIG